ncbi:NADH dehydrogenase 1 alpha subcomplex subunit 6 NDUFA6 [Phycomyces blakesleeanus]|uniref:NADH dehydrogenase 1 alpha subcomplex subunit 6 NDUFA6 n=2 Tax=Phycomyces blakesleeanus TaxID=4837 RepID=A0A162NCZ4_PHYB8|nr:NADH dehydrogenase 1 alpha subcomplex subunit 6 NDUFA6 [Phycomyces blakesleeanus NRRL 1555(-)]OAD68264.1 NADH dehydrogenase 1 alpha subcomplex subunit 6 NDUFA6 [Phycomyces blakesleeanus NRRL 1555(-)]|eukprot:XP_018286304.1 NADH dehydrogenase 1 alpha subcomplex subunit 6 NDUFA6 [Phycomyces blakesleeanus NRRL 1555(-)]
MAAPVRRSGLQQEVINFYRQCFRATLQKPKENRARFQAFVRNEFRNHKIRKSDFTTIEYMLRRGKRQLEAYSSPSIKDIHL